MPQRMIDFLYEHRKHIRRAKPQPKPNGKKSGHTMTFCNACKGKNFLHKKRLVLEVRAFATIGLKWQCQKCRTVDVRPLCREIRDQMAQDS